MVVAIFADGHMAISPAPPWTKSSGAGWDFDAEAQESGSPWGAMAPLAVTTHHGGCQGSNHIEMFWDSPEQRLESLE